MPCRSTAWPVRMVAWAEQVTAGTASRSGTCQPACPSPCKARQGGAAFGQQYGPVTLAQAADCVHAAIDAGINLIDTSAYYGKGRSEEILGEVLQKGLRDKVILCTKAGRLDCNEFDFSPDGMQK